MSKRYQVFISSTFRDLIEERQSALRAVLELDHMPAGMELFPATDDAAWDLIKDVIDASDYYLLIVGGRYGSLDETGISFTEKEYEYALSQKRPVIAVLHGDPDNLPRGKTETDESQWKKLQAFRSKVEKHHTCAYWNTAAELKSVVITSLTATTKRNPATGWIRADQAPSETLVADLLDAREKIVKLQEALDATRSGPPPGTENLMQGDDQFEIDVEFEVRNPGTFSGPSYTATIDPTWNEIFAGLAPDLINDCTDRHLQVAFRNFISQYCSKAFKDDDDIKGKNIAKVEFNKADLLTGIVQLRAIGLIRESQKKRSVRDVNTYWELTPYGDQLMVQLRALHRESIERPATGQKTQTLEGQ